MKPIRLFGPTKVSLAALAAMTAAATAQTAIPMTPIGTLTAFPTIVQTGTKPTLTWNIMYPTKVSDVATIQPPGRIVFNQPMYASVQIVGTGVNPTGGTTTGGTTTGGTTTPPSLPTDARVSVGGGSYQQVFYGTQTDVDPSHTLFEKKLEPGQTLDFGGRIDQGGTWSPFYTTLSSNMQVVALVKGDTPPTTVPLYQQSNLQSYLQPYLDGTGKVNIGPLSVLILMELNQTNPSTPTFNYSDQVLLVNISKKHSNNGHGNNLDGVDVSNPGKGKGGPNGEVDPSGGYDDERR